VNIRQAELAIAALPVPPGEGEGWRLDSAEFWNRGDDPDDVGKWSVRASCYPRRTGATEPDEAGESGGPRRRHTRDEEIELSIHLDRPTLEQAVDEVLRVATEVSRP
jgi:hypothetical protein